MQPPIINRKRPAPPLSAAEQPSANRGPPTQAGSFQSRQQNTSWQQQQPSTSSIHQQQHFAAQPAPLSSVNKWGTTEKQHQQPQERKMNPPKPKPPQQADQQRMGPPQSLMRPAAMGSHHSSYRWDF